MREERGAVVARVGALRDAKVTAERKVTWIQGLAKGDKMDGIVRDATELGATRLVPAVTAFSVVKLDDARGAARTLRWERIAREAARQCGRGIGGKPRLDHAAGILELHAAAPQRPQIGDAGRQHESQLLHFRSAGVVDHPPIGSR